jgi:hypothetical protein
MIRAARAFLPMCLLATVLGAGCSDVNCAEDINFDLESKGAATARAALDDWLAGSHGHAPEDGWRRAPSPERGSDVVCRADNWEVTVGHPPAGGFVVYATACSTAS